MLLFQSCEPPKDSASEKLKTEEDEARGEGKRTETEVKKEFPPKEIKSVDRLKIPNSAAGQAIMVHFDALYAVGKGVEENYAKSLNRLRESGKEVTEILSKAYGELDQDNYADRWAILQTLADIEVDAGLDPLIEFASAGLPSRKDTAYTDDVIPFEEESILRITAIRGVAGLSAKNDQAAEAMTRFFDHKDPTIRLEALNSFADVIRTLRDRKRQARLIKLFPADYKFDYKPVNPGPMGVAGASPKLKPRGEGNGPAPKK